MNISEEFNSTISDDLFIWKFLLILLFGIIFFGICSNIFFFKMVVLRGSMSLKSRFPLMSLSLAMFLIQTTQGLTYMTCYFKANTIFEDPECDKIVISRHILAVHRYADILQSTSQILVTLERLISIVAHEYIKINLFFLVVFHFFQHVAAFFYAYTLTYLRVSWAAIWIFANVFIIILNIPITFYVKFFSKKLYSLSYDLKRKHELYISYQICTAFVIPACSNASLQVFTYSLFFLQTAGYLFPAEEIYKDIFIGTFIWNFNITIFPWLVMLVHRGLRTNVFQIFRLKTGKVGILTINGNEINTNPTQNDYMMQLMESWK